MKKMIRFMSCLLLITVVSFLIACDSLAKEAKALINEELANIKVDEVITKGFEKYTTESGVEVSFYSDNEAILASDGIYHFPAVDTPITVYAKLSYQGVTETKAFNATASSTPKGMLGDAVNYIKNWIKDETNSNLRLNDLKYLNLVDVKFESLNLDVVAADGTINQQVGSQEAEILVTYYYDLSVYTQIRKVVVLGFTDTALTQMVANWVDQQVPLLIEGKIADLPTTHPEYGTTIRWYSPSMGFITTGGVVNIPVEHIDVNLSAVITKGIQKITRTYFLENVGGNTEVEFVKKWMQIIIPTQITGVVNHLHQQYLPNDESYYLKYQEVVNYGGVLNLRDGKPIEIDQSYFIDTNLALKNRLFSSSTSPVIAQADLDKLFYQGYTVPNSINKIWIVIHESGMPLDGQDALLLAKTQYNNAFTNNSPREASWHYQVDGYKIYQSFDDRVWGWHAGAQEKLTHGNSNGIGIEMCINQDGNYNGSMHNDAKLVAYLMHKYNLQMENVVRHYDFSGKECPSYMMRTDRYIEFLELVAYEYLAIKYLGNAEVSWEIDQNLLNTYFEKGGSNLYYNLKVDQEVNIPITLQVVYKGQVLRASNTLTLLP